MTSTITKGGSGVVREWRALPGSARAGLILSLLGFVVRFTIENEKLINGQVTCEAFDFGAWIIGLVTIVTGLVTLVEARKADRRLMVAGVGIVILAFGLFHLLRAYQVFLPLC
jgi:hypothetical protein